MNQEEATREYYQNYYQRTGQHRNSLRFNAGVLFQTLALEASVVRASAALEHDPEICRVLDVGCGGGRNLYQLLRLNYRPENFSGIDIDGDRINEARMLYPQMRFVRGDARQMEFADESFDLVYESTMFATLTDDEICSNIANEMLRVCRPGGYLLLVDWWFPKPASTTYKALSRRRLSNLFHLGKATRLVAVSHGALVPPVGRFLSRFAPFAYFATATLLPFLVGQVVYVLQRTAEPNDFACDNQRQGFREKLKEGSGCAEKVA